MREILFRGKRLENGEWIYGYYAYIGPASCKLDYIIPEYASATYVIGVDKNTIGEYTGLEDKMGNRIFEGDILHISNELIDMTGQIVFFDGCFYLYDSETEIYERLWYRTENMEVIGNIYDDMEE